jgi:hypothetical protein
MQTWTMSDDNLMTNMWLSAPKANISSKFSQLYHGRKDSITELVEGRLDKNCVQLTAKQRTA